ncbi:inositol monophosphatase family protein [Anaeromicropila populeti]|uniref:Myo-inositol-1(Or 4)-monophosphatase n=1 Tax=Anaeromicropila populeti TaxID=37658 RepID=A0A1I6L668_9FIRM|nr:inositol monophosphatase family protein [Anaeromicropila populeti]SFR98985.1 myo-inositol-1(or 4)-monophosphatase [Anaeromicropila populeti]
MREYINKLADYVFDRIHGCKGVLKNRGVNGVSPGGDAQFNIDNIAEEAVLTFIREQNVDIAYYSEDTGLNVIGESPKYILIIDPIDGTRPMAAGMEMACISIAVAEYTPDARIKDVKYALLKELKTGASMYADVESEDIHYQGYHVNLPNLNRDADLRHMFWAIEMNGHPAQLMTNAYGHLIDYSANTGGVFLFNSSSYAISRIITGQLDAFVDIGNRILKDNISLLDKFKDVGNGYVLHLFPYDIAASVFLAKKAGVIITDAYGNSLDEMKLMDISYENQQSCIAASTKELHQQLLEHIIW